MAASHALRTALRSSKPAFGAWITLPGTFNARAVALSSPHLSWVVIDCEHGLTPLHPGAAESISAVVSTGDNAPSVLVRVPATGASTGTGWQIKYALDAGARGVIVPMVSTPQKAREIVSESRFPPLGIRGFGNPLTHTVWKTTPAEYIPAANEDGGVFVVAQIETKEGVQNLEEIAAVDGLDVLLIGPYDLSISLGYKPPSPDPHPDVEEVIQQILKTSHAKGKKCAIYCTSGAQSAKRAAQGFDMINVTTDSGALMESLARNLAEAASGQV